MGQTRAVVTARHSHRQDPSPSSEQIVPSRSGPLQGASSSSNLNSKVEAEPMAKAKPMSKAEQMSLDREKQRP